MAVTYASNTFTVTKNTSASGTGTITCASTTVKLGVGTFGATAVTGVGTAFNSQLRPGSLITVAGVNLLVHSIQSNTALTAFRQSNTDNTFTLATATAFTYCAPTLWGDMLTAVAAQPTVAQGTNTSINFTTSSVTINANAVFITDGYAAMTFGSGSSYRLNITIGGYMVFRNGGVLTYNGPVNHSFFNGFLNVFNGLLTYMAVSPGGTARQDFFSPQTTSNGISAASIIYAGGGTSSTNFNFFTHLEQLAGKFGALSLINNTTVQASSGGGMFVQFGDGVYSNVTLPNPQSTFGITQRLTIYLARSGGNSVLINPTIPGSVLEIGGDQNGTAQLIDERWPDLPEGTVGSLARSIYNSANTAVTRTFTYYPGTLYDIGNPVYLRIANKNGLEAINGGVISATGVQLNWALYNRSTNTQTNYSPFTLTARRKDIAEITNSFTPVAPITYKNPLASDDYYTTDQSAATGIAANSGTKTVTISGTFDIDARYDWVKWWLSQNLSVVNFLSPNGTKLSYTGNWNDNVSGISNAGTKLDNTSTSGLVTVTGSITHPYADANGVRVTIKSAEGLTLSTRVLIDGSFIDADLVVATERVITVQPTSAVRVYAHAYGYQPKIINVVGGNAASYVITLLPESVVDTTLDTTIRDTIVTSFGSGFDAFSRLFLSVNSDLRAYTPAQVINALHYYVVTEGGLLAAAALGANSVAGFSFIRGGVAIRSPGFYAKVADSVTSTDALGVLVPLSIYVDPSVYVAMPTYTPVELNTSNVVLQYAPWTQQEADVPAWVARQETVEAIGTPLQAGDYVVPPTVVDIQSGLATEANVNTRASQASVDAIPTTPLLAADYAAPDNAGITAIKAKTDTLVNGPALADIEASTVLAKESTVASRASQASVDAIPTTPLLAADYVAPPAVVDIQAGLATGAQVTALGTPLQAGDYTAPDNATIGQIKSKVDTLENTDTSSLPTLAQIEGSSVLAKESSVLAINDDLLLQNQQIINAGVKLASLSIPHNSNTNV